MMNRKPTPQLKPKELELISAYLDGQLPESQMKQVRRRLSEDSAFKQAAQELGATRRVLRSAPRIKRRRSFTLTPEMVGKPTRVWSMGRVSGMMSIAATVLLAVVFAGDLFLSRGMMGSANSAAEYAMDQAMEMDVMSAEPADGAAEAPLADMPEAAVEEPAAEEALEAAPSEPVVGFLFTATAEVVGEDALDDTADSDQGFNAQTALPTATITPEGTQAPDQSRAAATEEVVAQEGLGSAETEKTGEADGDAEGEVQAYIEPEAPIPAPTFFDQVAEMPTITLVELVLLSLAIGSGILALLLNRKRG